jgi:hypothetical protein
MCCEHIRFFGVTSADGGEATCLLICIADAVDDCSGGKNGQNPEDGRHGSPAVEESAKNDEHNALRALHKADLAGTDESFCAGAGVADHQGCDHDEGREKNVEQAVGAGIVDQQAEEQSNVGIAIDDGVKECAEDGDLLGLAGDAAIHHVEDSRTYNDQAGVGEHADIIMGPGIPEQEGGAGVDDQAHEGEDVGRDARQGQAIHDLLQDEAATSSERACPGHFKPPYGYAAAARTRLLFGVVDGDEFENFQLAVAVGGNDSGDIADLLAHQTAPDWRGGRDEAFADV